MKQYLAEGLAGSVPFIVDRSKPVVTEAKSDGTRVARIPGRLSVCDSINGNGRRYPKPVWENNLKPGSKLSEAIRRHSAFGLLEHPADGIVTLLSPISHLVTEASLVQVVDESGKPRWEVHGSIEILETEEGKKLKALIEGGYDPLVSSRGYGSVVKGADGVDEVCDDYVCESWDVVINPSFVTAQLTPDRSQPVPAVESNASATTKANIQEKESGQKCHACGCSIDGTPKYFNHNGQPLCSQACTSCDEKDAKGNQPASDKKDLKESPSTGGTAREKTKTKTMDINELKSRISTLRSVSESVKSDDPKRYAENVALVEELHQEVAAYAAEDAKRAWESQKLHRELDEINSRLIESATAPAKQSKKLAENNSKLMKVVNAVGQTAVTYKKKLAEALKKNESNKKLIEELIRRGQGWQKLAESRKAKYAVLESDFNDACEALDLMKDQYHEDTTLLSRRVVTLEFAEKAQAPEIQKQLKEATRLRHIAAIYESLSGGKGGGLTKPAAGGKPGLAKPEKKNSEGDVVAGKPGKVTNENNNSAQADSAKDKLAEAKVVLKERDPRNINESVAIVQRLSAASTAK